MSMRTLMSNLRLRSDPIAFRINGTMPTATAPSANHLNGEKTYCKNDSKSSTPHTIANGLGHLFR